MACRGRCFALVDGVDAASVRHDEASRTGMSWFFCPAHQQFHAFFLVDGAPQPLCGECAVLFFDRAHYAVWVRQWDMAAVMSNAADVHADARSDLDAMLREMDRERRRGLASDADPDPLAPPDVLTPDVLREIPKDDWTYTSLGTTLIPHARFPGLFLLEYRTFHGALAYQPCGKDIDTRGLFKALRPIDQHGDPVFAQVRTWSCIVQAAIGLPKELRWVLATIYNFCNDMLRPEVDENTLWRMRPWLLHWLCVCEQLFYHFAIFADTPDVDWFARPKPRPPTPRPTIVPSSTSTSSSSSTAPVNSADLHDSIGQSGSPRSSACGTVIHHRLPRRSFHDRHETAHEPSCQPRGSQVSIIHAWLASQPHLPELEDAAIFDPTPRGCVSPKTRRSARDSQALPKATTTSRSAGSQPAWSSSRLNPRAAAFEPLSKQPLPPLSSDKGPRQASGLGDNDGSETDCSSCSCSSSSTLGSISTCTDCDELPELARYGGGESRVQEAIHT